MNDETGWLIQKDNIEWWTGSGWTQDSYEAVRFARKEDAERVIFGFPAVWASNSTATEHAWMAPTSPAQG
jgi:hypothetical protein